MQDIFKEIDQLQDEINKSRPLDKDLLKKIKEYFRIGVTYSSNALEGNTLTETETKVVLEDGITIGGKPLRDHLEAIGLSNAFDLIYKYSDNNVVTEENIKELHRLFYQAIDEENAGKYRTVQAIITGSKYPLPKPETIQELMQSFVSRFKELRKTMHPVKAAAIAHKEFVFIHPFVDGNGRVARLLMNLVLLQAGYTIAIVPPVLRSQYIQSLEKAHKDDIDFVNLIAQCVKETQKDFLRLFK